MPRKKYRYLFGPVPSRRFGRSLGIDLTPHKTCSLDCVFCQLGRTTNQTLMRKEYVATKEVITELEEWIKEGYQADYLTLSGCGEPTLHSRFGEVLEFIRQKTAIPAVLLTNGAMLNVAKVRESAACASVVKTSFSVWDQESYELINRPHPELEFVQMLEGLKAFRTQFKGQLWIEVFLVAGMNSEPADVSKIAALLKNLYADRIQLNTATRPPAEKSARAVPMSNARALSHLFKPAAEVIVGYRAATESNLKANKDTILAMLERRPSTVGQIAAVFEMHPNEVAKYLGALTQSGQISVQRRSKVSYYLAARGKKEAEN